MARRAVFRYKFAAKTSTVRKKIGRVKFLQDKNNNNVNNNIEMNNWYLLWGKIKGGFYLLACAEGQQCTTQDLRRVKVGTRSYRQKPTGVQPGRAQGVKSAKLSPLLRWWSRCSVRATPSAGGRRLHYGDFRQHLLSVSPYFLRSKFKLKYTKNKNTLSLSSWSVCSFRRLYWTYIHPL